LSGFWYPVEASEAMRGRIKTNLERRRYPIEFVCIYIDFSIQLMSLFLEKLALSINTDYLYPKLTQVGE
jgi:hypothetical protein